MGPFTAYVATDWIAREIQREEVLRRIRDAKPREIVILPKGMTLSDLRAHDGARVHDGGSDV